MTHAENARTLFDTAIGQVEGPGEWIEVTQEKINAFADVTGDHQFIHVDPELSATASPFGTTIAHGFLTLSLLTPLTANIPQPPERAIGVAMGINYGFEKVRFIAPVRVNSKIRATFTITKVTLKDPNTIDLVRTCTVEIDGEAKPALVADWVTRLIYT